MKQQEEDKKVVGEPIDACKVIDMKAIGLRDGRLMSPIKSDLSRMTTLSSDEGDCFNLKEDEVENQTLFYKFCDVSIDKI